DVADWAGTDPGRVIFASGGTEANNLAIIGRYSRVKQQDPDRGRIILGATEHPSVREPVRWLERHARADVDVIGVDASGRVDPDELREMLAGGADVALVAIMAANNETGVLSPIRSIGEVCAEVGVALHVDAVQAAAWYSVAELRVPAGESIPVSYAVTGHKLGAPVGIGALVGITAADLKSIIHGGGQEGGVRPGTSPTALAAALAAAVVRPRPEAAALRDRVAVQRNRLVEGVLDAVPEAVCHTPPHPGAGLPGHAMFTFPGASVEVLLFQLDQAGVAASAGSACSAGVVRPSPVLTAMGVSAESARAAVRFSLGWDTGSDDIDRALDVVPSAVTVARNGTRNGLS
ncbi:MAG: aminotransferase class V-fold PLP-dependent enzyme, partial [Candidatus Nanopelagicales bacterium]|nr:aminotransferase class V-fold PLP-dependent enzyme [Candidatus Nanopelagicales bacterium]